VELVHLPADPESGRVVGFLDTDLPSGGAASETGRGEIRDRPAVSMIDRDFVATMLPPLLLKLFGRRRPPVS
jgi:hypothetical protein